MTYGKIDKIDKTSRWNWFPNKAYDLFFYMFYFFRRLNIKLRWKYISHAFCKEFRLLIIHS